MQRREKKPRRLEILSTILTSPIYLALTLLGLLGYSEVFYYLILASNKGVFLVTVPIYLIYALTLSAALLLTTSIYAVSRSIHAKYAGAEGGALSILTSSAGSLVVGCSCYAPIISSALYAIGFGTIQVSGVISFLGVYQLWFVVAFVVLNLLFIYYQLGRITVIGGSPARRK